MFKRGVVLISDIHFNINTLKEAEASLRQAIKTSDNLGYTLIICGDLNDTKAIIRAEVANKLLEILSTRNKSNTIILIGNHDLINEKGKEHSLNFLDPYATIINEPFEWGGYHLIPYQTSLEVFRGIIKGIPEGSTIVMHQGVQGAFMGDYMQDKTSVHIDELKAFKVYSGHYHRHQNIGTVTYIGNPYTLSFGEANDSSKGFLVLDEHERMTKVPTKLRRHHVIERDNTDFLVADHSVKPNDLLWLKIKGKSEWLSTLSKEELGKQYIGHNNFRLDLIPTDEKQEITETPKAPLEVLDLVIESSGASEERKTSLKKLAKELLNGTT